MIETIKKRSDFLSVTARGKKVVTGTFILQMLPRDAAHPAGGCTRFGFTVTRKMGNAVKRNRIKRRLRAALAQITPKHAGGPCDFVLISRPKTLTCPFDVILRDMDFAFARMSSMKNDNPKTTTG